MSDAEDRTSANDGRRNARDASHDRAIALAWIAAAEAWLEASIPSTIRAQEALCNALAALAPGYATEVVILGTPEEGERSRSPSHGETPQDAEEVTH